MQHLEDKEIEEILEVEFPNYSEEEETKMNKEEVQEIIPILPLRNSVLFPGVVLPITVGREKSIRLINSAHETKQKLIGITSQISPDIEFPKSEELQHIGVLAKIIKRVKMPDGTITIIIQGRSKIFIDSYVDSNPFFTAKFTRIKEKNAAVSEIKALTIALKAKATEIIELSPNIPNESKVVLENIDTLGFLVNFIASNLPVSLAEKQQILEMHKTVEKAKYVLEHLDRELQVLKLSEEIHSKVKEDIDQQQREFILRQQMKTIQDELGDEGLEQEIEAFRARAEKKNWSKEAEEAFEKEIRRLYRLNPNAPDYGVSVNYIEWLLDLPWNEFGKDTYDLEKATKILDRDHYGLTKVKERILEFLAVLKLKKNMKSPILCFYGPPGVGKTSLGKSIAEAVNREFVRISLGGVSDEAEIRGHRKTYIGAMPGRIIKGMKKAGVANPVFLLDEIDKLGLSHHGDPSSALLEVLDPEQNNTFNDNFIELDYDLSNVMFIATANSLDTIHPALRDRMEIIEINGYTLEEKVQIAKRHLVPKIRREHGLSSKKMIINDKALQKVVANYTRESGVRQLSQKIAELSRKVAKKIVLEDKKSVRISNKTVKEFLGEPKIDSEIYQTIEVPGVVTGLAWTPVGGEILFIEAVLLPGTGKLSLTGQLGDVMKESANVAFTYLKSKHKELNIPIEKFKENDVHIHVPAGAIPKDGPSAGIAMLTAIASLMTGKVVKPKLAMTSEITLRGRVLPVGGIKEKVLAAIRSGITEIMLCDKNKADVMKIDEHYRQDIEFHFVQRMEKVLEIALNY